MASDSEEAAEIARQALEEGNDITSTVAELESELSENDVHNKEILADDSVDSMIEVTPSIEKTIEETALRDLAIEEVDQAVRDLANLTNRSFSSDEEFLNCDAPNTFTKNKIIDDSSESDRPLFDNLSSDTSKLVNETKIQVSRVEKEETSEDAIELEIEDDELKCSEEEKTSDLIVNGPLKIVEEKDPMSVFCEVKTEDERSNVDTRPVTPSGSFTAETRPVTPADTRSVTPADTRSVTPADTRPVTPEESYKLNSRPVTPGKDSQDDSDNFDNIVAKTLIKKNLYDSDSSNKLDKIKLKKKKNKIKHYSDADNESEDYENEIIKFSSKKHRDKKKKREKDRKKSIKMRIKLPRRESTDKKKKHLSRTSSADSGDENPQVVSLDIPSSSTNCSSFATEPDSPPKKGTENNKGLQLSDNGIPRQWLVTEAQRALRQKNIFTARDLDESLDQLMGQVSVHLKRWSAEEIAEATKRKRSVVIPPEMPANYVNPKTKFNRNELMKPELSKHDHKKRKRIVENDDCDEGVEKHSKKHRSSHDSGEHRKKVKQRVKSTDDETSSKVKKSKDHDKIKSSNNVVKEESTKVQLDIETDIPAIEAIVTQSVIDILKNQCLEKSKEIIVESVPDISSNTETIVKECVTNMETDMEIETQVPVPESEKVEKPEETPLVRKSTPVPPLRRKSSPEPTTRRKSSPEPTARRKPSPERSTKKIISESSRKSTPEPPVKKSTKAPVVKTEVPKVHEIPKAPELQKYKIPKKLIDVKTELTEKPLRAAKAAMEASKREAFKKLPPIPKRKLPPSPKVKYSEKSQQTDPLSCLKNNDGPSVEDLMLLLRNQIKDNPVVLAKWSKTPPVAIDDMIRIQNQFKSLRTEAKPRPKITLDAYKKKIQAENRNSSDTSRAGSLDRFDRSHERHDDSRSHRHAERRDLDKREYEMERRRRRDAMRREIERKEASRCESKASEQSASDAPLDYDNEDDAYSPGSDTSSCGVYSYTGTGDDQSPPPPSKTIEEIEAINRVRERQSNLLVDHRLPKNDSDSKTFDKNKPESIPPPTVVQESTVRDTPASPTLQIAAVTGLVNLFLQPKVPPVMKVKPVSTMVPNVSRASPTMVSNVSRASPTMVPNVARASPTMVSNVSRASPTMVSRMQPIGPRTPPNVSTPPPMVLRIPPNVSTPPLNVSTPPSNVSTPPPNVSTTTPIMVPMQRSQEDDDAISLDFHDALSVGTIDERSSFLPPTSANNPFIRMPQLLAAAPPPPPPLPDQASNIESPSADVRNTPPGQQASVQQWISKAGPSFPSSASSSNSSLVNLHTSPHMFNSPGSSTSPHHLYAPVIPANQTLNPQLAAMQQHQQQLYFNQQQQQQQQMFLIQQKQLMLKQQKEIEEHDKNLEIQLELQQQKEEKERKALQNRQKLLLIQEEKQRLNQLELQRKELIEKQQEEQRKQLLIKNKFVEPRPQTPETAVTNGIRTKHLQRETNDEGFFKQMIMEDQPIPYNFLRRPCYRHLQGGMGCQVMNCNFNHDTPDISSIMERMVPLEAMQLYLFIRKKSYKIFYIKAFKTLLGILSGYSEVRLILLLCYELIHRERENESYWWKQIIQALIRVANNIDEHYEIEMKNVLTYILKRSDCDNPQRNEIAKLSTRTFQYMPEVLDTIFSNGNYSPPENIVVFLVDYLVQNQQESWAGVSMEILSTPVSEEIWKSFTPELIEEVSQMCTETVKQVLLKKCGGGHPKESLLPPPLPPQSLLEMEMEVDSPEDAQRPYSPSQPAGKKDLMAPDPETATKQNFLQKVLQGPHNPLIVELYERLRKFIEEGKWSDVVAVITGYPKQKLPRGRCLYNALKEQLARPLVGFCHIVHTAKVPTTNAEGVVEKVLSENMLSLLATVGINLLLDLLDEELYPDAQQVLQIVQPMWDKMDMDDITSYRLIPITYSQILLRCATMFFKISRTQEGYRMLQLHQSKLGHTDSKHEVVEVCELLIPTMLYEKRIIDAVNLWNFSKNWKWAYCQRAQTNYEPPNSANSLMVTLLNDEDLVLAEKLWEDLREFPHKLSSRTTRAILVRFFPFKISVSKDALHAGKMNSTYPVSMTNFRPHTVRLRSYLTIEEMALIIEDYFLRMDVRPDSDLMDFQVIVHIEEQNEPPPTRHDEPPALLPIVDCHLQSAITRAEQALKTLAPPVMGMRMHGNILAVNEVSLRNYVRQRKITQSPYSR